MAKVVKKPAVKLQHSTKLRPLEYRVWRSLERIFSLDTEPRRILVACSGGLDSMALLECLAVLQNRLGFSLVVAIIHHGSSESQKLGRYRDRAVALVEGVAAEKGLECVIVKRAPAESVLKSEASLREFRHSRLREIARESRCRWIALAHHADDLLETRLIRLIRGTGADGLASMRVAQNGIIRPFLQLRRTEIETYARDSKLKWLEDPSNRDLSPLRNWIRRKCLPQIEKKRAGSVANLLASLQRISDELDRAGEVDLEAKPLVSFACDEFNQLGAAEQRRFLARLLTSHRIRGFSSRHIDEIIKRLRSRRGTVKFKLLNIEWQVKSGRVNIAPEQALGPSV